jgi:hypothetical protein
MTKVFEREEFRSFYDDGGSVFSDLEFRRCSFVSSGISITRDTGRRSVIRDVRLLNCEQRGCALETAVVEDVVVDGLKTNGTFQAWAAVFKHLTLRGRLGKVMLSPAVASGTATQQEQRAFDEANAAYYAEVDWAIDISEAEFEDAEIQRVPASLIRRDSRTQVVVTRARAMEGTWRGLDLSATHWATSIEFMLRRGDQDVVLVAPKRHRNHRQLLDGLMRLRDAGTAEPD